MAIIKHNGSSSSTTTTHLRGQAGSAADRNILVRILCCPCRFYSTLSSWDKCLTLASIALLAINLPSLLSNDRGLSGSEGLGRFHGAIKEKIKAGVDASSQWTVSGIVGGSESSGDGGNDGGGGGGGGGIGGLFGLRGSDGSTETIQTTAAPASSAPTPSPTQSPTQPTAEDPIKVAAGIAQNDLHVHLLGEWDVAKFPRPDACTDDRFGLVRSSGMDGSNCRGKPYTQSCCFSVLTKKIDATWLDGFLEEIRDLRFGNNDDNDGESGPTFVGALLGGRCHSPEGELRISKQTSDSAKDALDHILKRPKLFCSGTESNSLTSKWGKDDADAGGGGVVTDLSNIDKHLATAGASGAIKDAVFIVGGEATVRSIAGGMVTLARTRYVVFDYDWRESWSQASLRSIVDGLDEIGHTCYWSGDGKLWRITGCWQDFYGYRSWSHIACANRNLAPKLSGRMEKIFLKTIGAE